MNDIPKNVFIISRASGAYNAKPCEEAYEIELSYVDERSVDDPAKLRTLGAEDWYKRGTNHRVENGWIKRDMYLTKFWVINLDIHNIMDFVKTYGKIVLDINSNGYGEIIIYDYYLE